ncbi:MAG: DegT/DnrJ/EryC1/StrS family aminotransferase [Fibrobacteres bacterium]|nr:DegT/DnrJ/EryC1/StrS family aminotransferase [Fibrobacterota bacterium]
MAVPVNEPLLDGNEKKYLIECIETGWISSEGPFVKRFEEGMAARMGRSHGIAVCNGSVALDAAVAALRLGPGDAVMMPAFTIISCAAAVVRAGATPIVVDSDPATFNIDPLRLRERVQAAMRGPGPRPKAIMVAHIYGLPVDMDPVLEVAREFGLRLIEDAAEMHGQTYRGRPCGSFGDLSTFSFYPNKHVTTGEGGMLLADDPDLAARCRDLRNLFFDKERRYIHQEMGWNLRMSNIQAALGVAQLERLDAFVAKKRHIGATYTRLLSGTPGLQLPVARADYAENIYWVYPIVLGDDIPFDAVEAVKRLSAKKIGVRHFFWPMHLQPVFRKMGLFAGESHPVSERLSQRGFYLPSGMALTDAQMEEAAAAVKEVLR